MISLVTGGAGFIGSNLADELANSGESVRIFDNFSTGKKEFLNKNINKFEIYNGDLKLDRELLDKSTYEVDTIYHFAANADVRFGWENPRIDLDQNLIATLNVLESAVRNGVKNIIFSSTGSVYGEASKIPTPEDYGLPIQTSLYGASKYSAESFIQAYAKSGKINATIFRFVSVLGPRYTHGHVIDFVRQLKNNPDKLKVLGDGFQRKSYMHVSDCINGVLNLRGKSEVEIFNLGTDETCTVNESISVICNQLNLSPEIIYAGGKQGWVGDNPHIHLDIKKAENFGWKPNKNIKESIIDTVNWLNNNPKVLN